MGLYLYKYTYNSISTAVDFDLGLEFLCSEGKFEFVCIIGEKHGIWDIMYGIQRTLVFNRRNAYAERAVIIFTENR